MQVHRLVCLQRRLRLDHVRLRIDRKSSNVGQAIVFVGEDKSELSRLFLGADETEFRQQLGAVPGTHDQTRLAGKSSCRFGGNGKLGVQVKHATGDIDGMYRKKGTQILVVRQSRSPVDHLGEVIPMGTEYQSLTPVIQPPALDHGRFPGVRHRII